MKTFFESKIKNFEFVFWNDSIWIFLQNECWVAIRNLHSQIYLLMNSFHMVLKATDKPILSLSLYLYFVFIPLRWLQIRYIETMDFCCEHSVEIFNFVASNHITHNMCVCVNFFFSLDYCRYFSVMLFSFLFTHKSMCCIAVAFLCRFVCWVSFFRLHSTLFLLLLLLKLELKVKGLKQYLARLHKENDSFEKKKK